MNLYDNIKRLRTMQGMSQEELAKKVGYNDRSSIAKIESGSVDLTQSKIIAFAKALGTTPEKLMDLSSIENIISVKKIINIPVIGTICAGNGIWCEENYEDYISIDEHFKADFALRVKGDSMVEANIHDGDIAFFKKQSTAQNGQIVAVLLTEDNEATLKKIYFSKDITILQPCNSKYSPIITNNYLILGLLKGIYKEIKQ